VGYRSNSRRNIKISDSPLFSLCDSVPKLQNYKNIGLSVGCLVPSISRGRTKGIERLLLFSHSRRFVEQETQHT
jgi:hypothetical protein